MTKVAAAGILFATAVFGLTPGLTGAPATSYAPNEEILLYIVGDIMLDRGVEFMAEKNGGWEWPFREVRGAFQKADVVIGNLESVISDKGENQGSIYSFRADPDSLAALAWAGFGVVSAANNHSLDYGAAALLDSVRRLSGAGILSAGAGKDREEARRAAVTEAKGVKVGTLAYTTVGSPLWDAGEDSPGVAWVDSSDLGEFVENIRKAKSEVDVLVVSVHFGEEYAKEPTSQQRVVARAAVEAGADIVAGHHTHVAGETEEYKGGYIAYGLGNFVFDQGFSEETTNGTALRVRAGRDGVKSVEAVNVHISDAFQPRIR